MQDAGEQKSFSVSNEKKGTPQRATQSPRPSPTLLKDCTYKDKKSLTLSTKIETMEGLIGKN